jgi:dihydroorotase
MNPPLRSQEDQQALLEGLLDGTIDIIATDHAPHTIEEKQMGMELAPFGIVGLETCFPLLYTHLVLKGTLSLPDLVEKVTLKPRELFKLPYGILTEGAIADITIIDLHKESQVDPNRFISKGKNTPFTNWITKGWPVKTLMNGMVTWEEKETTCCT